MWCIQALTYVLLQAGVRRISLRGNPESDFWVGNVLAHDMFLAVVKAKRRDIFVSTIEKNLGRDGAIDGFWAQLKAPDIASRIMPPVAHHAAQPVCIVHPGALIVCIVHPRALIATGLLARSTLKRVLPRVADRGCLCCL